MPRNVCCRACRKPLHHRRFLCYQCGQDPELCERHIPKPVPKASRPKKPLPVVVKVREVKPRDREADRLEMERLERLIERRRSTLKDEYTRDD